MVAAVLPPCTRTPMLAIALAYASVMPMLAVLAAPAPVALTSAAVPSAANASALPLFDVVETVGTTLIVSPLLGTPARLSSKPFRLIGVPAVHVPAPVLPSLSVQL